MPLFARLFDTTAPATTRSTRPTTDLVTDMRVVKSTASVIWKNRGNRVTKKRSRVTVDEESDDCQDDDEDDDYAELTDAQRKKYKSYLKYIGRQFEDKDEDGEAVNGTVNNVLMYNAKHVCFEYRDSSDSKQYIYADSLLESSDAKWLPSKKQNAVESSTSSGKQPPRSGWRGWAEVATDEEMEVSLADQYKALVEVSATADNSRLRKLRRRNDTSLIN